MDNYLELEALIDRNLSNPLTRKETLKYLETINLFKSFNDWTKIIRLLFRADDIRIGSPELIVERIRFAQEQYRKSEVDNFLIFYLKEESEPEKNFSNFFYALHQQHKHHQEELFAYDEVITICNRRLERYIKIGKDIQVAFTLFYSCWDYVDDKNIVHITDQALKLMRVFIDEVPQDYLEFIVRPKYSPPTAKLDGDFYSFVFEPFTKEIFNGWDKFSSFLQECEGKANKQIVEKVKLLFHEYESHSYKLIPILENNIDKYGLLVRKWIPEK